MADLGGRSETSLFWSGTPTQAPILEERSRRIGGGVWGYDDLHSARADLRWATRLALDALAPGTRDTFQLDDDLRDVFSTNKLGLILGRDFLLVTGNVHAYHTPTLHPSDFFKKDRPSTTGWWQSEWTVPETLRGIDLRSVATIGSGICYGLGLTSAHEKLACAARMAEDWALVNAYWAAHGQPCLARNDAFLVVRD